MTLINSPHLEKIHASATGEREHDRRRGEERERGVARRGGTSTSTTAGSHGSTTVVARFGGPTAAIAGSQQIHGRCRRIHHCRWPMCAEKTRRRVTQAAEAGVEREWWRPVPGEQMKGACEWKKTTAERERKGSASGRGRRLNRCRGNEKSGAHEWRRAVEWSCATSGRFESLVCPMVRTC